MNDRALAEFLTSTRKNRSLTLRQVQAATGVSNAYLSQLERSKIKQPSPNVLYTLAEFYGVSYAILMERAGYPVPMGSSATTPLESLAARIGDVTADEEDALADYLTFIRERAARRSP